jgi:hypothetical protein
MSSGVAKYRHVDRIPDDGCLRVRIEAVINRHGPLVVVMYGLSWKWDSQSQTQDSGTLLATNP